MIGSQPSAKRPYSLRGVLRRISQGPLRAEHEAHANPRILFTAGGVLLFRLRAPGLYGVWWVSII